MNSLKHGHERRELSARDVHQEMSPSFSDDSRRYWPWQRLQRPRQNSACFAQADQESADKCKMPSTFNGPPIARYYSQASHFFGQTGILS